MSSGRFYYCITAFVVLLFGLIGFAVFTEYSRRVENAKHVRLEKSETRSFELVGFTPPKHFYLDFKDVETGTAYTKVYVSKHCNSWRQTVVSGKVYQIAVETYRDDRNGAESRKFKNLYDTFCIAPANNPAN